MHEPLVHWDIQMREVARITLCGSTKFRAEYELWNKRLTLAGFLVYSVSGFGHSGDVFTAEEKKRLDQMHLAKIDASHMIVVINPGGYIGQSTRNEIKHAEMSGKLVFYTHLGAGRYVYELRTGTTEELMRYKAFDWSPAVAEQTRPEYRVGDFIGRQPVLCEHGHTDMNNLCPKCEEA